jgi:hypothetical protein
MAIIILVLPLNFQIPTLRTYLLNRHGLLVGATTCSSRCLNIGPRRLHFEHLLLEEICLYLKFLIDCHLFGQLHLMTLPRRIDLLDVILLNSSLSTILFGPVINRTTMLLLSWVLDFVAVSHYLTLVDRYR